MVFVLQPNKSVPEKLTNGIQIGINYRLCAVERVSRVIRIFTQPVCVQSSKQLKKEKQENAK